MLMPAVPWDIAQGGVGTQRTGVGLRKEQTGMWNAMRDLGLRLGDLCRIMVTPHLLPGGQTEPPHDPLGTASYQGS